MLIIAGEIRMQPGTRDQFLTAVAPMVAATLREPGCRTYAFSPDADDADLIRLYELWDGDDALRGHFESPHMAEWQARRAALPVASSDLVKYRVSDAIPL